MVAEIGMLIRIRWNNSGRLIPTIDTIAASLFPLSDDSLSTISYLQKERMEMDNPHFLSQAAKNGSLQFKG
jgi:hypothetical protein